MVGAIAWCACVWQQHTHDHATAPGPTHQSVSPVVLPGTRQIFHM
jgi:hypothetical protein